MQIIIDKPSGIYQVKKSICQKTYKEKVYRFIKITKYNVLSGGGISYKAAVKKQKRIDDSVKTYEDYIHQSYQLGFISKEVAISIINDYNYAKNKGIYSYKYPNIESESFSD